MSLYYCLLIYKQFLADEKSATYCAECMAPLKNGLDSDSRKFFSSDLFCHCGGEL
jgi:hypothetical protein